MAKKKKELRPKPVGYRRVESGRLLEDIGAYLYDHGWDVVVIGGTSVQQPVGSRKFNFQFVVNFTGSKVSQQERKDTV